MRPFVVRIRAVAFVAALTLSTGVSTTPAAAQAGDPVTVSGTMSDAGVTCGAMRSDDGVLYTFRRTAQIRQFHPGDRVKIEGRVQPAAICQQGTTLVVTRAEKID